MTCLLSPQRGGHVWNEAANVRAAATATQCKHMCKLGIVRDMPKLLWITKYDARKQGPTVTMTSSPVSPLRPNKKVYSQLFCTKAGPSTCLRSQHRGQTKTRQSALAFFYALCWNLRCVFCCVRPKELLFPPHSIHLINKFLPLTQVRSPHSSFCTWPCDPSARGLCR